MVSSDQPCIQLGTTYLTITNALYFENVGKT